MINQVKKQILRTHQYRQLVKSGNLKHFKGYVVERDEHLKEARRLHADVYLKRGFVEEHEVGKDGMIKTTADPHHKNAVYFVVCEEKDGKEEVVLTARQIRARKDQGLKSFPLYVNGRILNKYRQMISKFDPERCTEISALAKKSGTSTVPTLILYRMMWHYSVNNGDQAWLMACSPSLYGRLKRFFGPSIFQIGQRTKYVGEDIIPAMVDIQKGKEWLEKGSKGWHPVHRPMAKFVKTPPGK